MKELTRSHIEYCGRKMVFLSEIISHKKRSHWLGGFSYIQKHHLRSIRPFSGSTIVYHQQSLLSIIIVMSGLLEVVFINYVPSIAMLSIA